jgi:hypothetical protein
MIAALERDQSAPAFCVLEERLTKHGVVPANAGTHNHWRLLLQKAFAIVPNTEGTAYGPCFRSDDE